SAAAPTRASWRCRWNSAGWTGRGRAPSGALFAPAADAAAAPPPPSRPLVRPRVRGADAAAAVGREQCVEQIRDVLDHLGHDMHHLVVALEPPGDAQKPPGHHGAAEALEDLLPDHHVCHPRLVLEREEDDPLRGPRPLAHQHQPRHRHPRARGRIAEPGMRQRRGRARPVVKRVVVGQHENECRTFMPPRKPRATLAKGPHFAYVGAGCCMKAERRKDGEDHLCGVWRQGTCRGGGERADRDGRRPRQRHSGDRGRLRRRLRLLHLPCLCRCRLGGEAAEAGPDGGGHARLRLRARSRPLAADLPDQGDGRARRAEGLHAGKADLMRTAALAAAVLAAAALTAAGAAAQGAGSPDGLRAAEYSVSSTRYGHDALGPGHEWAMLALHRADGGTLFYRNDREIVFEDTAPRLIDADGDGDLEALVVESSHSKGSRLAVWTGAGRL